MTDTDRDTSQDTIATTVESSADSVVDSTGSTVDTPADQQPSAEPEAGEATVPPAVPGHGSEPAPEPAAEPAAAAAAAGAVVAEPVAAEPEPAEPEAEPAEPVAAVPETAEAEAPEAAEPEANSAPDSEAVAEPEAPEAVEPEPVAEPVAEAEAEVAVAEPVAEVPAEPTVEAAEPVTEVPAEPTVEAAEPVTEVPAEPTVEAAEPVTEVPAEPTVEAATPDADAVDAPAEAAAPAPPVVTETPAPPPTAVPHTVPHTAVPAAQAPAATPVAEASANPGRWGRVDADGTVYVKHADGERAVGSWHAGEPAEGLAHYARRFDDVRTEVELLAARLVAGSGDPKHTLTSAKHIKESLTDAALVGDLAGLAARVEHVLAKAQDAVESLKHARDEARGAALARKQELVAEVEKIAEQSTQWKVAGDRLRSILDEWKTIKGVDRKTDDQLWKRFSKARDTFNRRRGAHFADLDRQRAAAKERKQELVKLAEEISESDDWGPAAARYRDLMTEWKAAGRAPKEADDTLWQQFRAAQDKFFSRRSSVFNERDAELVDNAKRKESLLAEAEKINARGDLEAARAQLHRIQERWDEVGKVPRERIRDLEGKLRAIEDRVRNAADAQWRRTDPEAEARAAQFRERVEQFEAQAAKARSAGDKRRAEQAEAQAAQWREWLAAAENAVASR